MMRNFIVIVIVVAIGWCGNYLYKKYRHTFVQNSSTDLVNNNEVKCITKNGNVIYGTVPYGTVCERLEPIKGSLTVVPRETSSQRKDDWNSSSDTSNNRAKNFKCDGRIHCSQMQSCDEATFFLRNCPGVKMDGNNDGIPCESQWCR